MKSPTKKHYSAEFKAQALELLSIGKPVAQVAKNSASAAICFTAGGGIRRDRKEGAKDHEP